MCALLLQDILNQPESLRRAAAHHAGPGADALRQAAATVRKAGAVLLTGMGSSLYACGPFSYLLHEQGIANRVIETAELLHFPQLLRRDEVAILVSRSGETIETVQLLPLLEERQIPFLAVTSVRTSTLARACPATVLVDHLPDELVAVQSYTATVLSMLSLGAAAAMDPASEALDQWLPALVEESEGWRGFLEDAPVIYLLGRGPSFAAAQEGGLMLNEVAKQASSVMTPANFRHGPVEIVDARFRAVVFATQPKTLSLDLALAADLARFGGQVRVLTLPGVHSAAPAWRLPEVDPRLAPVFEAIPLQVAAWRLALWRGVPLGAFRFASQVTRAEAWSAGAEPPARSC